MGNYSNDSRIVLTLDAGGTNMVFGAMRGEEYVGSPITLPSNANDLDLCLKTMVLGFESVMNTLAEKPVAISFAFPGPADYPNGIIGGYLPNFPSFRDGVALGPFLQDKFGIPVYINNDGDLYAFGEALGGVLPEVNVSTTHTHTYTHTHTVLHIISMAVSNLVKQSCNEPQFSCLISICLIFIVLRLSTTGE